MMMFSYQNNVVDFLGILTRTSCKILKLSTKLKKITNNSEDLS